MKKIRAFAVTVIAAVAFLAMGQNSFAQVVPFNASSDFASYSFGTGVYDAPGNGNHMGNFDSFGVALLTGAPDEFGVAPWAIIGEHTIVAADGSKMYMTGGGTVQLIPLDDAGNFFAVWEGEFVISRPGTGRFANASTPEPLTFEAINYPFTFADPLWFFSYEFYGQIDLGKTK